MVATYQKLNISPDRQPLVAARFTITSIGQDLLFRRPAIILLIPMISGNIISSPNPRSRLPTLTSSAVPTLALMNKNGRKTSVITDITNTIFRAITTSTATVLKSKLTRGLRTMTTKHLPTTKYIKVATTDTSTAATAGRVRPTLV